MADPVPFANERERILLLFRRSRRLCGEENPSSITGVLAGLLGGALLLVAVFGFDVAGARGWLRGRTSPIRSLVVLPLQNLSNDPQQTILPTE